MIDILNDSTNLCLSGGAKGADLQWGMTAGFAGHSVIHWSFSGHRSDAPPSEIVVLSNEQLDEADQYCLIASKTLKRYYPPKSVFVKNLLRRNYFQVAWSSSCYAVASIDEHGLVTGGTSWATQMFMDKFDQQACPVYVFDQVAGYWTTWNGTVWERIYSPPKPSGIWAGVGSRDLNPIGKLAIRVLMDYRPVQNT